MNFTMSQMEEHDRKIRLKVIEDMNKWVNDYPKTRAEWYKYYIKTNELKQSLKELGDKLT